MKIQQHCCRTPQHLSVRTVKAMEYGDPQEKKKTCLYIYNKKWKVTSLTTFTGKY